MTELKWECKKCDDEVVSYSDERHDMNYCRCGYSAVYLEEWYMRSNGAIEIISKTETKDEEI